MADTFTKLFSSITDSTVWDEDSDTRIVWITMLAMADKDGYVGASVTGLAARARVSKDCVLAALEKFMSPDVYSRTKDHEGRRVLEVDRGWQLLNHKAFREKRDAEFRRIQNAESQARSRARKSAKLPADIADVSAESAQADTDTDTDTDIEEKSVRAPRSILSSKPDNDVERRAATALLVRQFYGELMNCIASFPSQGEKSAKACAALVRWADKTPDPKQALQAAFLGFRDDEWARNASYPITDLAERTAKYHAAGFAIMAQLEAV